MNEEIERKDFFHSFMKEVEKDLKHTGVSYVFTDIQYEYLKKKYNIEVVRKDDFMIKIKLVKE